MIAGYVPRGKDAGECYKVIKIPDHAILNELLRQVDAVSALEHALKVVLFLLLQRLLAEAPIRAYQQHFYFRVSRKGQNW